MRRYLVRVVRCLRDERGSTTLENALWIILFVFVVAAVTTNLGAETSSKFQSILQRISQIGTP